jgi:NADPH2:quinone reductase
MNIMRAYVLTSDGPQLTETPAPTPRPSELLVRVRAAALNRVDLAMARGHVHGAAGGPGAVLGVEWAGDVVSVGAEVPDFQVGDRVMGSGAGAFGEYTVTDWGRVLPIPPGLDYDAAATLPVALQTMHDALVTHGELRVGQRVLVLGASSGVGLMALQIAKELGASWVAGTSTQAERRSQLLKFGADLALDSNAPDWVEQLLAVHEQGADLSIDQLAGPTFDRTMRATRIGGRIVNVGRLAGMQANFDFDLHALRRLSYIGVTFRTRTRAEVRDIGRSLRVDLWPALQRGRLRLPIDKSFAFGELAAALAWMRENRHFGKIVLRVADAAAAH